MKFFEPIKDVSRVHSGTRFGYPGEAADTVCWIHNQPNVSTEPPLNKYVPVAKFFALIIITRLIKW